MINILKVNPQRIYILWLKSQLGYTHLCYSGALRSSPICPISCLIPCWVGPQFLLMKKNNCNYNVIEASKTYSLIIIIADRYIYIDRYIVKVGLTLLWLVDSSRATLEFGGDWWQDGADNRGGGCQACGQDGTKSFTVLGYRCLDLMYI